MFVALATLASTYTVTGISVESAKKAEIPAEGNHRVARFGVQDRTTTVFVYVFVKPYKLYKTGLWPRRQRETTSCLLFS